MNHITSILGNEHAYNELMKSVEMGLSSDFKLMSRRKRVLSFNKGNDVLTISLNKDILFSGSNLSEFRKSSEMLFSVCLNEFELTEGYDCKMVDVTHNLYNVLVDMEITGDWVENEPDVDYLEFNLQNKQCKQIAE